MGQQKGFLPKKCLSIFTKRTEEHMLQFQIGKSGGGAIFKQLPIELPVSN